MEQILKVLVGSQAHGLATDESDNDYRGVFVAPTSEFLKIGGAKPKETAWLEGEKEDDVAYEIGHFLNLALHSNPAALEVFVAPVVASTLIGNELRDLFPYVWSSKKVLDSFLGYANNQRKKMLDDKYEFRQRKWSYASHYIRTLIQGIHLLREGELKVRVPGEWVNHLQDIKAGKKSEGEIIDLANMLTVGMYEAHEKSSWKEADVNEVNIWLLDLRQEMFYPAKPVVA